MATWRVGPFHLPEPRYLGPVVVAWAVSLVVMIAERDLGSSLLFFTLFVVMLWVATERALYLGLGAAMFVVGRVRVVVAVRARARSLRDLAQPVGGSERRWFPDRAGDLRASRGEA